MGKEEREIGSMHAAPEELSEGAPLFHKPNSPEQTELSPMASGQC